MAAFAERAGRELRATGEARPLLPDTEVAAYRVVQEALTNTMKHAGADDAQVRLDWEDEMLTITVTDDGRGAAVPAEGGGHGLIGIRERAAACGGTASAGPRPDGPGMTFTLRLPTDPSPAPIGETTDARA